MANCYNEAESHHTPETTSFLVAMGLSLAGTVLCPLPMDGCFSCYWINL
jgi:hypothetical protein